MGHMLGYARGVNESAIEPEASTICVRSHDPAWPLLCEGCGYVIEGLPRNNVCPECGRSIESSLPEARIGTIWQRADNPGWREAWQTMRAMLWRPKSIIDTVRIDDHRSWDLLTWCAKVASLISLLWTLVACTASLFSGDLQLFLCVCIAMGFVGFIGFVLQGLAIVLLVRIERIGMRFIGARHRWRIDHTVSRVVCAHAAVGWLTGGVLISVSISALIVAMIATSDRKDPYLLPEALFVSYFGSWFLGLLHFESLVYLGMRRCRYANRPPPRSGDYAIPPSDTASS